MLLVCVCTHQRALVETGNVTSQAVIVWHFLGAIILFRPNFWMVSSMLLTDLWKKKKKKTCLGFRIDWTWAGPKIAAALPWSSHGSGWSRLAATYLQTQRERNVNKATCTDRVVDRRVADPLQPCAIRRSWRPLLAPATAVRTPVHWWTSTSRMSPSTTARSAWKWYVMDKYSQKETSTNPCQSSHLIRFLFLRGLTGFYLFWLLKLLNQQSCELFCFTLVVLRKTVYLPLSFTWW